METCTLCTLHQGVSHPLLPTRPYKEPTRSDVALLVVGEAPGFHEDESGVSWSGESGTVLQRFIAASHLDDFADIYLSNACRCRPPQNVTPTKGQITKCRVHLARDLENLQSKYKHVAIFCCGAVSVTSVCGKGSLTNSFRCQGTSLTSFPLGLMKTNPHLVGSPLFFTYHPAAVLVGRNPALVHAMSDHFLVVRRWLENPTLSQEKSIPVEFGPDLPHYFSPYIVLDIETYGIMKGANQTVFHPTKSWYIDKIPFGSQIETVGIRYMDESGTPHYCIYSWKKHLSLIRAWFHRISLKPDAFILGQNIPFDIMYLKANDSVCSAYLTPGKVKLMDTLLSSFLWFEQRPEKGLKELASLFGLVDYSASIVSGSSGTALSQEDPHLHYYNALDLYATDQLHTICLQEILKRYGKGTSKFSAICKTMCNEVLWDCITMGLNGLCMDVSKLKVLHKDYVQKCDDAITNAASEGWILEKTGSDASTRKLITQALIEADLMDDPRVKLTDKRKDIGVNVDNVNLIRSAAPPDFPYTYALDQLSTYTTYSKLVSSYTKPLLTNPKKGIVDKKSGMCYPTWYPIPLYEDRQDSSGSLGGTIQGRITCLRGDTLVKTIHGDIPIQEIVEKRIKGILTITHSGVMSFVDPVGYIATDPSTVWEIGLSDGSFVHASDDHRFVTLRGTFVTSKELIIGTRLRHIYSTKHQGYVRYRFRWVAGKIERVYEVHRLLAEYKYGQIPIGSHIHHHNQIRDDNRIENIEVLSAHDHHLCHGIARKNRVTFTCLWCGCVKEVRASIHKHKFCSRICSQKYRKGQKGENYTVTSIRETEQRQSLYCLTIPETETFVLGNGLVSGNCKQPAIQTQPEPIKGCLCSRFRGGRITSYDLSQIELRIGALLSGDPVMIKEYQQDIDRHTETALLIFPHADPHSPTFRKTERQAGKTLNFLVLYRGGPSKYKETLMRDVGIDLPLETCELGIYNFDCKYPAFRTWQNDLIEFVRKHGYLEVPTGWSRTFATGRACEGYINEICNFPIQTVSAQILQNAQYHISLELQRRRMRTLMIPQIYDACYFDVPNPDEEAQLDTIVHPLLTEPPLVTQLYLLLGRYVPIKYEKGH